MVFRILTWGLKFYLTDFNNNKAFSLYAVQRSNHDV